MAPEPGSQADTVKERDFHHPFQPYDIQKQFMSVLYDSIEEGKVAILESPTGTGKSLSLICGSLTWLRDHKRRIFEDGLDAENDDDEPDWMVTHAREQKRRAALQNRADLEARLERIRQRERKIKERGANGERPSKRVKLSTADSTDPANDDEAAFVLSDYESDEDVSRSKAKYDDGLDGLSAETRALMKKLGMSIGPMENANDADNPLDELKIFFCSRTHSQLTQFAGELRRVNIPPALLENPAGSSEDLGAPRIKSDEQLAEGIKHITLGSRKNLCINPKISSLRSATAVNERCLELQQPGISKDRKCPFIPTKETETLVNDFRDHALAEVRDIEDLGSLGKKLGVCPYYASRSAVKSAEIATLPYPLLLQKSAREALDISLKDHVVVIDEAHNLMDAITGIYSVTISMEDLSKARSQLTVYLQKFRNRLKGKNRVYVAQTVRLIDSLIACLSSKLSVSHAVEGKLTPGDLMAGKGVDQINLYKLMRYLQESKLARKVESYTVHAADTKTTDKEADRRGLHGRPKTVHAKTAPSAQVPVLTHFQNFMLALTNPSPEGRFFYSRSDDKEDGILQYMLLDPANAFRDVVEEARAVILAGGTMSPMSDYMQHLFPYLPESKISTLSCGHVIPPSNIISWPIVKGLGHELEFTHQKREKANILTDLGDSILSLIGCIPDGVVVFFPSYAYMEKCISHWKSIRPGNKDSIWSLINTRKPIFADRRPISSDKISQAAPATDTPETPANEQEHNSILSAYEMAIQKSHPRGAILFSVVGGSLSEGINFSDQLGRAVIVVGLPFPNPSSAEWQAKMQYITQKASKSAAREFYENACMRAVNQSIGRAIRHKNDYAAILLLDKRYDSDRIKGKLPGWIRESVKPGAGVKQVCDSLEAFFRGRE